MTDQPALLARGPWPLDRVECVWRDEHFDPGTSVGGRRRRDRRAARPRLAEPRRARRAPRRTTPSATAASTSSCSRCAGRCASCPATPRGSVSSLCVIRDSEGRWLAGRRAEWLSSWAGRWALGAGGAVDVGEWPADTLLRELGEEWSVTAERAQAEALVRLPHGMFMFVGQAWLPPGAEVTPDHEHDEHAWWPADPADWPDEADEPLRRMATLLA